MKKVNEDDGGGPVGSFDVGPAPQVALGIVDPTTRDRDALTNVKVVKKVTARSALDRMKKFKL